MAYSINIRENYDQKFSISYRNGSQTVTVDEDGDVYAHGELLDYVPFKYIDARHEIFDPHRHDVGYYDTNMIISDYGVHYEGVNKQSVLELLENSYWYKSMYCCYEAACAREYTVITKRESVNLTAEELDDYCPDVAIMREVIEFRPYIQQDRNYMYKYYDILYDMGRRKSSHSLYDYAHFLGVTAEQLEVTERGNIFGAVGYHD